MEPDQDGESAAAAVSPGGSSGSTIHISVKLPSSVSSLIEPPCLVMMSEVRERPSPVPLGAILGGDKWLENPFPQVLPNTGAVVAEAELGAVWQPPAGDGQFRLKVRVRLLQLLVQGLTGVGGEVEKHPGQFLGGHCQHTHIRVKRFFNAQVEVGRFRTQRVIGEFDVLFQQRVQVCLPHFPGVSARVAPTCCERCCLRVCHVREFCRG